MRVILSGMLNSGLQGNISHTVNNVSLPVYELPVYEAAKMSVILDILCFAHLIFWVSGIQVFGYRGAAVFKNRQLFPWQHEQSKAEHQRAKNDSKANGNPIHNGGWPDHQILEQFSIFLILTSSVL